MLYSRRLLAALAWTVAAVLALSLQSSPAGTVTAAGGLFPAEETYLPVIFDATIMSDSPYTTFGQEPTLRVGYYGYPGYGRQRTLIRFNISELPTNAEIDWVALGFCCLGGTADEAMTVSVHEILGAWRESDATWEGCAELKGPVLATQSLPAVVGDGYWVEWSGAAMAEVVETWVEYGYGFGFMLIGDEDEARGLRLRTFASRESSQAWCRPYLHVVWHAGETVTVTPTLTHTPTPSITPTLTATPGARHVWLPLALKH